MHFIKRQGYAVPCHRTPPLTISRSLLVDKKGAHIDAAYLSSPQRSALSHFPTNAVTIPQPSSTVSNAWSILLI